MKTCPYCGAADNGTCAYPSENKPGCLSPSRETPPCGFPGAKHAEHLVDPALDWCVQCGRNLMALALMHSVRNEAFPQRTAPFNYKATEHLIGDNGPRCTWCFTADHAHEAIFRVGDHQLCWCCWFHKAFHINDCSEEDNVYGPSHISRQRDCERRSFNRGQRLADRIARWPREFLAAATKVER